MTRALVFSCVFLASSLAFAANDVEIGETTADGGMSKDLVNAIAKESGSGAVACLGEGVQVPSSITVQITIEPDKPIQARVLRASIKNRKAGKCLLDEVKQWPLEAKQRTLITQKFNVSAEGKGGKDAAKDDAKDGDKGKDDAKGDAKGKDDAKDDDKGKDDAKDDDKGKDDAKDDDAKGDAKDEDDAKGDDDAKEEEDAEPQGAIRIFRDIVIKSTLDRAGINAKVGEQDDELLACYVSAVGEDDKIAGSLDVIYTISAGKVTEVEFVKSTTIKNEDFRDCAKEAIGKWEFDDGSAVVTQRFGFTPTKHFAGKAGLVLLLKGSEGPMAAAAIIKVAVKKNKALAKCFKKSVKGKKAPITVATVDVVINKKGKTKAGDISISPPAKKLDKCLKKTLNKLKFKKGGDEETTASFELVYTPKKRAFPIKKPKFKKK